MRAILAVALMIAAGPQLPGMTATQYGALIQDYRTGNPEEAVTHASRLDPRAFDAGFRDFMATRPPAELLSAAAAMHTEVALRPRIRIATAVANHHLALAAGIVELGMPPRVKRLGISGLTSRATVSRQFRRLWLIAAVTAFETGGQIDEAERHLVNARLLFLDDGDVLLLSGIAQEMRASSQTANVGAGTRRAALGRAEAYLRASLEVAPERLETRLRLGRILQQRGRADEARPLLTAVSDAPDTRLAYLAALFLGGLEDAAGDTVASAAWYARAAARIPSAQAARLAASELHHRAGERQQAAAALTPAIGSTNTADPWWAYVFGEYWRMDLHLDALRKMGRS